MYCTSQQTSRLVLFTTPYAHARYCGTIYIKENTKNTASPTLNWVPVYSNTRKILIFIEDQMITCTGSVHFFFRPTSSSSHMNVCVRTILWCVVHFVHVCGSITKTAFTILRNRWNVNEGLNYVEFTCQEGSVHPRRRCLVSHCAPVG